MGDGFARWSRLAATIAYPHRTLYALAIPDVIAASLLPMAPLKTLYDRPDAAKQQSADLKDSD